MKNVSFANAKVYLRRKMYAIRAASSGTGFIIAYGRAESGAMRMAENGEDSDETQGTRIGESTQP